MGDPWSSASSGLTAPAENAAAITPSDSTDLPVIPRGVWVGSGGDLTVILAEDANAVTFAGVASGTLLPIRPRRVLQTGTTAGQLVGVW
jgi:hypothetical protein